MPGTSSRWTPGRASIWKELAELLLRADLHIHSCYSFDSSSTPQGIVARCLKRGINCIAITDHGTVAGALATKEIAPFPVIVGQEILTREGELMGFFLKEDIPAGLSPAEAIARIQEQGGIVGVPHPFDNLTRSSLSRQALERLLPQLQVLEGFNARSLLEQDAVARLAREHGLALSAGSDAHTLWEIGNAFVEMPPFTTPQEFLASLAQGQIRGHRSPLWVHGVSVWHRLLRRLKGRKR